MSTFTERLYSETKDDHLQIDTHPFTELIKTNKDAGNLYINFNKICIYQIQKHISNNLHYTLKKKLHKNIILPDMFITHNLSKLMLMCSKYPIEHEYLFKLGLLAGGNLLKKYIDEKHHDFLTFNSEDSNFKLIKQFKTYLNDSLIDENEQELFIHIVKESYKIIKLCFDDFYYKFSTHNYINNSVQDYMEVEN